eukprot:14353618-Heterocapsa_arctica.AAC.1
MTSSYLHVSPTGGDNKARSRPGIQSATPARHSPNLLGTFGIFSGTMPPFFGTSPKGCPWAVSCS